MKKITHTIFIITGLVLILTACQKNYLLNKLSLLSAIPKKLEEPLYPWPLSTLTDGQVAMIKDCGKPELYQERYREIGSPNIDSIIAAYAPLNDCDWAMFALVISENISEEEFSEGDGLIMLQNAIFGNPGLVFSSSEVFKLANYYLEIVEAPPITEQQLSQVDILYEWDGMGAPVTFDLAVIIEEVVSITGLAMYGADIWEEESTITTHSIDQEIPRELIEPFGINLTNLIPVDSQGALYRCEDNYPNWEIILQYSDGTLISLDTNESNIYFVGGPFQTEINGQDYVLGSLDFLSAVLVLVDHLELSFGSPSAIYCYTENYTEVVFPYR